MQTAIALVQASAQMTLLDRVLAYENREVIERYKDKLGLAHEAAEQLFDDVKRFLYICGTQPGVWSPTDAIDDGWHEFMLYSRDYREFCNGMFGKFVDHVPRSYLDDSRNTTGRARETYRIAEKIFGLGLSANWKGFLSKLDPCTACGNDSCTWQPALDAQDKCGDKCKSCSSDKCSNSCGGCGSDSGEGSGSDRVRLVGAA